MSAVPPPQVLIELVHENAKMPVKKTDGSSGYDIFSCVDISVGGNQWKLIPCGFKIQVPPGFEAQIRSRSGLALNNGAFVLNGVGTIDSDYRGEVGVILANFTPDKFLVVKCGDRIAQMVITRVPKVDMIEGRVNETDRGNGGFGSTGR